MVYVRLAQDWTDKAGTPHAAGELVDIDAATLAELEAAGVVASREAGGGSAGPGDGDADGGWAGPGGGDGASARPGASPPGPDFDDDR